MSNQKNEWIFQDSVTKKEFKILYDMLKRAKLPFSTEHNAMYGLEDVVLVLLYMCKNGATANRAVTELSIMFRDDKNDSPETAHSLFDIVNIIIQKMISEPKKINEMYKALPKEKQDSITNRDKTT